MGALIAMIGMVSVDLIVANDKTLVAIGDLASLDLQIVFLGIILVGTLVYHDVKGGILLGIATLAIFFWTKDSTFPTQLIQVPHLESSPSEMLDFSVLWDQSRASVVYPALGAFLFIAIF
jgi:AGZA family xanthine/uracil permease-like MFS transporter